MISEKNLDNKRGALGYKIYRQFIFKVKDFLEYQKKSNNYYQLKKLIEFFDLLQTNSLIKFFSDKEYRNLVTISEVVLTKGKQYCWVRIIMERKFNLKLFMSLVL